VIWWHKPLGLQEPVKIYLKTEAQPSRVEEVGVGRSLGFVFGYVVSNTWKDGKAPAAFDLDLLGDSCEGGPIAVFILFVGIPILFTISIGFSFFVLFLLGIVLLLRNIESEPILKETSRSRGLLAARIIASFQGFRYRLTSAVTKFVRNLKWLQEIFREGNGFADFISSLFGWFVLLPSLFVLLFLFTIFLTPFFALLFIVSFMFTAVFGIVTTSTIRPGASHVPYFYAPTTKSDRWSRMVFFALFGVIFGGLHCVGWYFQYPTQSEQTLWRAPSLILTVILLIVALTSSWRLKQRVHTCKQ